MTDGVGSRTNYGTLGLRLILTLIGAAALIVSLFLSWTATLDGEALSWKAFWRTSFDRSSFLTTIGLVMLALALVAIIGMAMSTGWLSRLAGVLGIVGVVLFIVEVYRAAGPHHVGAGAWLCLAGSVVLLIAGFVGPVSVQTVPAHEDEMVDTPAA